MVRWNMRFAGAVLAVCLLLTGCGGGDDPKAKPTEKATTEATVKPAKSTKAPVAEPAGLAAPGDLSNFRCSANAEGAWAASGILKNGTDKRVSYQVTVFVGEADGKDAEALAKEVQSVNANGSIKVELTDIPAAKDASRCYVQVLRK